MGKMYFSKMNINEDIYEVYDKDKKLDDLLNQIFSGINAEIDYFDSHGARIKFFDLNIGESGRKITGRLGYIKAGVHSSYDPDKDTAIDTVDKNKMEYITFYFDVDSEMLAYMTLPVLQKKKVLECFKKLIKKGSNIGVEFSVESNINDVWNEIKKYQRISKLKVKLLPPNGDKMDFDELLGLRLEDVKESNATKIYQTYQTQRQEGINSESKMVRNFVDGTALGYTEIELNGKDKNNNDLKVVSSESEAFTKDVPNDKTKNINAIKEIGRAGIKNIMVLRSKIKTRMGKKK